MSDIHITQGGETQNNVVKMETPFPENETREQSQTAILDPIS